MSATAALVVAALAGVVAVLLAPPPNRPGLRSRRAPVRWRRAPTAVVASLVTISVVWLTVGATAATIVASAAVSVATVVALSLRHHDHRALDATRRSVSRASATVAAQLRAGLAPHEAVRQAAEDWPLMAPAAAIVALGGDPVEVWERQAQQPGQRGLQEIAHGWRLCVSTGAPLAPTLERVADALESEEALAITVTSELAAPRATGRMMAALPLVGIGLGYALGGDPMEFLLQTTAGRCCLLGGCILAAAGVWWIERIAGRVAHEI